MYTSSHPCNWWVDHQSLTSLPKTTFQSKSIPKQNEARTDPIFRMLLLLLLPVTVLSQGVTTPASPTFPFEDIDDPNAQCVDILFISSQINKNYCAIKKLWHENYCDVKRWVDTLCYKPITLHHYCDDHIIIIYHALTWFAMSQSHYIIFTKNMYNLNINSIISHHFISRQINKNYCDMKKVSLRNYCDITIIAT